MPNPKCTAVSKKINIKRMPNNYYDDAANPKTLLNVNVNER